MINEMIEVLVETQRHLWKIASKTLQRSIQNSVGFILNYNSADQAPSSDVFSSKPHYTVPCHNL